MTPAEAMAFAASSTPGAKSSAGGTVTTGRACFNARAHSATASPSAKVAGAPKSTASTSNSSKIFAIRTRCALVRSLPRSRRVASMRWGRTDMGTPGERSKSALIVLGVREEVKVWEPKACARAGRLGCFTQKNPLRTQLRRILPSGWGEGPHPKKRVNGAPAQHLEDVYRHDFYDSRRHPCLIGARNISNFSVSRRSDRIDLQSD